MKTLEKVESKTLKLTISMSESLVHELDNFCFGHSYNRSEAIREAVRRLIN